MIFTTPVQYAIRTMTYLGEQEAGKLSPIREVSASVDIPLPFLAKIVNRLARRRLVLARRGRSGGIMLRRPAGTITIGEIVEAMGATLVNKECVLGIARCGDSTPCPVHDSWKPFREMLVRRLHEQTVRDLARARAAKLSLRSVAR